MKIKLFFLLVFIVVTGVCKAQVDSTGLNNVFGKKAPFRAWFTGSHIQDPI